MELVTPKNNKPVPVPVLKATFTALTFCFKFLRTYLVRDFKAFWGYVRSDAGVSSMEQLLLSDDAQPS